MLNKEKHRLLDYIIKRTGEDQVEILEDTVKRTNNNKKIECKFGQKMGIKGEKDPVYGTISITINNAGSEADIVIFDSHHNMILRENLLIKKLEENSNDFNLYLMRGKIKKKKGL